MGSACISRGGRAVGCTTGVDPVHERLRSRGDADEVRVVLVQLGVVQPQRRAEACHREGLACGVRDIDALRVTQREQVALARHDAADKREVPPWQPKCAVGDRVSLLRSRNHGEAGEGQVERVRHLGLARGRVGPLEVVGVVVAAVPERGEVSE